MELKSFINETLHQIIDAVKEVQKYGDEVGAGIPDHYSGCKNYKDFGESYRYSVQLVEFEVGLISEEGSSGKVGIGVDLSVLKVGGEGGSNKNSSSSTKVKFSVPLYFYHK